MSGPTSQTTTSTSAPSNPDVNPTLSKLLKGVQSQYDANPQGYYYDKPSYAGTGATTNNALSSMLGGANDPTYANAFKANFADMADTAAGNKFGTNDPGFQRVLDSTIDKTKTGIYQDFNNSGLFGSDSNMKAAGEGIANAVAGLEYGNLQNDIARQERAQAGLGGAFGSTMLPSQTALHVGQFQDTNAQAQRQADMDLYLRKMGAPTDQLARLSSILAGNAAAGGTNSSVTSPVQQPNPLQMLLGGGLGLAGLFM